MATALNFFAWLAPKKKLMFSFSVQFRRRGDAKRIEQFSGNRKSYFEKSDRPWNNSENRFRENARRTRSFPKTGSWIRHPEVIFREVGSKSNNKIRFRKVQGGQDNFRKPEVGSDNRKSATGRLNRRIIKKICFKKERGEWALLTGTGSEIWQPEVVFGEISRLVNWPKGRCGVARGERVRFYRACVRSRSRVAIAGRKGDVRRRTRTSGVNPSVKTMLYCIKRARKYVGERANVFATAALMSKSIRKRENLAVIGK